jgi:hypothetical protein
VQCPACQCFFVSYSHIFLRGLGVGSPACSTALRRTFFDNSIEGNARQSGTVPDVSDVMSDVSDVASDPSDVTSDVSDTASEGADVASEQSDAALERSGIASELSGVTVDLSGAPSDASGASSEASGVLLEGRHFRLGRGGWQNPRRPFRAPCPR